MKKSCEISRSLFVVKDIKAGEIFTEENICSKSGEVIWNIPRVFTKKCIVNE